MTENFILAAFRKLGEDPLTVKLMKNVRNSNLSINSFNLLNFHHTEIYE